MIEALGINKRRVFVALAAFVFLYNYFEQIIEPDWPALLLSPLLILGFVLLLRKTQPLGEARYLLTAAAVLLVPVLGIYGELQEELDPDWEAWVLTPLIFLGGWALVMSFVEIFSDE